MASYQRRSKIEWQSLIQDFDASGQSVTAFCVERDIGPASFYQWRKRLSTQQSDTPLESDPTPSFVDVSALANEINSGRWLVELVLGNGVTLRLNRD